MAKLIALVLSTFIVWGSAWAEISSVKCQGGDGPNPLQLVDGLKNNVLQYPSVGEVQEFVLLESKNALIYRNHEGMIFELNLRSGKSRKIASSRWPLSSIKDENDRFITLRDRATVLDTGTQPPTWRWWSHKNSLKHVYWHRFLGKETLFSVDPYQVSESKQRISVYSFSRKGVTPHLCNLFANKGEHFFLGEGHVYPYIFLYKTKKEGNCTRLSYFNIQIEGELLGKPMCQLYTSGQYSTSLPGNILEVYQFPELMQGNHNMFVVRTDDPNKNLLWDDGIYGCRFYNFGSSVPMVLNSKQAVLASWSEQEGLSLVYPRRLDKGEPTVVRPLLGMLEGPITQKDLILSDNGKTLFVLARMKDQQKDEAKRIIRVNLTE